MIKRLLLKIALTLTLPLLAGGQSAFEFTHFNQTTSPELGGNNFKCVAVARGGYIWAGSQYHGLVQYDTATKQWRFSVELSDVLITDMKADQKGNIWVANAGRSGLQGGGSNIGGGINKFLAEVPDITNFYTIAGVGNLTSRNARSIWIDKIHPPATSARVWLAQGTYISTNITRAGGFSVGDNGSSPYFTKGYVGLQVTHNTGQSGAGTPACMLVAGNRDEVWVFVQANYAVNQLLVYNAETKAIVTTYDATTEPKIPSGFVARAIYGDNLGRIWIGLQANCMLIYDENKRWQHINFTSIFPQGIEVSYNGITGNKLGDIYIATNLGLVYFDAGGGWAERLADSLYYRRYGEANGLLTNRINALAYDDPRFKLWVATDSSIVAWDPPCIGGAQNCESKPGARNGFSKSVKRGNWSDTAV